MKTLDKKISVSSDQLDTLTTEQRADKFAQVADDDGDDGDGDVGGDKYIMIQCLFVCL